jgi:hypothetical protein
MVCSRDSRFYTYVGFGAIHGIVSVAEFGRFDRCSASLVTQHDWSRAASSSTNSYKSPPPSPQDKTYAAIESESKLGSRMAPQFAYLAVSVPKHRKLRMPFRVDAHRVRGVISVCLALSPVESFLLLRS